MTYVFVAIFSTSSIFKISDYVRSVLGHSVQDIYKHSQIINQFQALRHNLYGRNPVYTYQFSDRYARYMTKEKYTKLHGHYSFRFHFTARKQLQQKYLLHHG
jgi:hypothetical protein